MEENQNSIEENKKDLENSNTLLNVSTSESSSAQEKPSQENEQEKMQEQIKKDEELSLLQEENALLKKREEEAKEFLQFYPQVNPYALPQEVFALAKKGNSLSCAYAFYLLKKGEKEKEAKEVNKQNNSFSLGNFQAKGNPFLTEDEVKKMTKEEVKKNFEVILASMKNWN